MKFNFIKTKHEVPDGYVQNEHTGAVVPTKRSARVLTLKSSANILQPKKRNVTVKGR